MNLTLSDDDVRTLHGLLHDYLPGLKFETARSKAREIRHVLVERQALCERLLDRLCEAPSRG
jgi:hypothetical protein